MYFPMKDLECAHCNWTGEQEVNWSRRYETAYWYCPECDNENETELTAEPD